MRAYAKECIFVRGATEGINLVMHGYGRKFVGEGDEVIISEMEHHANIVPWQMLCEEKGARLRVIPMNDAGELLLDEYDALLNERTRIVAVAHVSNALGTVNPVKEIIARAHKHGVPVLLDGAQSAPHLFVDMQDLDCDFFVLSGHKMFAPTGSGVVYGKAELLEKMNPFQGGGDMIRSVTFEKTTYADLPNKFEAGTPAIASQIGLGAAIEYLTSIGRSEMVAYEKELLATQPKKFRQSKACVSSAQQKKKLACSLLLSKGSIHTTSVPYSIKKVLPCVRGIIAHSRRCNISRYLPLPVHPSHSTIQNRRRMCSPMLSRRS